MSYVFRGDKGTTSNGGPRLFHTGGIKDPVMDQATVTVNISVPSTLPTSRQLNASRYSNVSYPNGSDVLNLNILYGEVLVGMRKQSTYAVIGNPHSVAFSSLNGLNFSEYSNAGAMQRDMYFAGIAKDNYDFRTDSSVNNRPGDGIAVIGAGSTSTINTGKKQFMPGDAVTWRLPRFHVNRQQRNQKDDIPILEVEAIPDEKLLVILEPFDPNDVYMHLQDAYMNMFDYVSKHGVAKFPSFTLNQINTIQKRISSQQYFAMAKREEMLMAGLRMIDVLSKRGIVTINAPENADLNSGSSVMMKDTTNGNLSQSIAAAENKPLSFFLQGLDVTNIAERTKRNETRDKSLHWLAGRMGLVGDSLTMRKVPVNKKWVEDSLNSIFSEFIIDQQTRAIYTPSPSKGKSEAEAKRNPTNFSDHYLLASSNYIQRAESANVDLVFTMMDNVIGTALSSSKTSEQLDLIVKG